MNGGCCSKGDIPLTDINPKSRDRLTIRLKFSWHSNQFENLIQINRSVDSSQNHGILTITIIFLLKPVSEHLCLNYAFNDMSVRFFFMYYFWRIGSDAVFLKEKGEMAMSHQGGIAE